MSRHNARLGTLRISSGQTASTALSTLVNMKVSAGHAVDFVIYAPAALTGTVAVQVSPIEDPAAGDWKNASVAGTVVTVAAGSAEVVPLVGCYDLRLLSGSAEGANRDFVVVAQFHTDN